MTARLAFTRRLAALSVLLVTALPGASATASSDDSLLEILLENGSITPEQYERLRAEQTASDDASGETAPEGELPPGSTAASNEAGADIDPVSSERVEAIVNELLTEELPVKASYGSEGFRLETPDGNWQTNLQWRFQFRLTNPYQGDPRQLSAFDAPDETSFIPRRLRMKIGGHGYRPWLEYYFEIDLMPLRDEDDSSETASARVIDWRVDVAKYESFTLRAGQWKIDYNRERVESSSRQQFVERSIVNRIFTIDRQMGVQLRGRLFDGTPGDISYYGGVFNGQGRGVFNDDNNLMYVGRLQWNFLGRQLALRQTDVERTEKPTASLSASGAHTIGRCTRWSSSGCGNLDGFTDPAIAEDSRFKIDQAAQGFAFKWQGFSLQQEFHWKRVNDRVANTENDFYGTYAQTGYFFNEICDWFPEPLELAFRYAWLEEPNATDRSLDNEREEFTAGANWFFAGHNNKLTFDYSHLKLDDRLAMRKVHDDRFRFQWDISF